MTFSVFLLLLLPLLVIVPQERSPEDVFARIRAASAEITDASATYVNTVQHRYGKQARSASGRVLIKRGNKYRIENDLQTIVTDGKTVWMYNPGTAQVMIDRYREQRLPLTPEVVLTGLPKELTPTGVREEKGWLILTVIPNKGSALSKMFTSAEVWCRPDRWIVERVESKDRNNTTTIIELSEVRLNSGIDDQEFQFTVTKSMTVVRLDRP